MAKSFKSNELDRATQQLRKTLEEAAQALGPDSFRELGYDVVLGFRDELRQSLAEGKITEDHPGYQFLLEAERAKGG